MEYFIPKRAAHDDESLASFVRRRFGSEVFDRIVQPLVGGIYTADPEKLSLRATMPRFLEWEQQYGSLIRGARAEQSHRDGLSSESRKDASGARYGLFTTLAGGLSELLDALAAKIQQNTNVRLNTAVTALTRASDGSGFGLSFSNSAPERFDAVVLAVPAHQAANFTQELDASLASELSGVEYASSAVVLSGHALADVRHPLDAAGLVIPAIERRKTLAVSFASRKFPGRAPDGRVLLRTFVGGATQPEILERSDDELLMLVRSELEQTLGVSGNPDFSIVARYRRAMPQYHVGHVARVERIEKLCSAQSGLELAGNYLHGVGIPDCIQSGEQAAERVLK
jgi:protoporphyrinogen/coproporphyrinogen III oxidase